MTSDEIKLIDWDLVKEHKGTKPNECIYCSNKIINTRKPRKNQKTKDHIIPRVRKGLNYVPYNTVPACSKCNHKGRLFPSEFREKAKAELQKTGKQYWQRVINNLNKLLIDNDD